MRSHQQMLNLILEIANADDRIRAVSIEGSTVTPSSVQDKYSDFDITFFVRDVRDFTKDNSWISCFGEILIVQMPDDFFDDPYDYSSHDKFAYLMQFTDGNRIDLTLIDVKNIELQKDFCEPRKVLLNKDAFDCLSDVDSDEVFYIQRPDEKEYHDTCNEFRWLSLYIAKGICRQEFYYAKRAFDVLYIPMLIKMLNWKIAFKYDYKVSFGSSGKYFKKYLSEDEMARFQGLFPDGSYEDMEKKLYLSYDYFEELAKDTANKLNFSYNKDEASNVRRFLQDRLENK